MSQRQNAKKSTLRPTPIRTDENHNCVVCGRWGCFGVVRRDAEGTFNIHDPSDWYCTDHKPVENFPHMGRTWIRKFEDAYLEIKRATNANS